MAITNNNSLTRMIYWRIRCETTWRRRSVGGGASIHVPLLVRRRSQRQGMKSSLDVSRSGSSARRIRLRALTENARLALRCHRPRPLRGGIRTGRHSPRRRVPTPLLLLPLWIWRRLLLLLRRDRVPKVGRDRRVSKHGANHVVYGSNSTFRFAILRGCVGTREAKNQTLVSIVRFETRIIILATIIALQTLNGQRKLSANKC